MLQLCYLVLSDRAEKRLRMRAVDSFWRIFDRLISERLALGE